MIFLMIRLKSLFFMIRRKQVADIHFVFTEGIGKAVVEKVPVDEVIGFL